MADPEKGLRLKTLNYYYGSSKLGSPESSRSGLFREVRVFAALASPCMEYGISGMEKGN